MSYTPNSAVKENAHEQAVWDWESGDDFRDMGGFDMSDCKRIAKTCLDIEGFDSDADYSAHHAKLWLDTYSKEIDRLYSDCQRPGSFGLHNPY
jgi:hypothetical protein